MTGRVALVCGATGTIGSAVARVLAESGYSLALHYRRDRAGAERLVAELPGARAFACDLTVAADVVAMVAEVEKVLGGVQVLVNAVHAPLRRPVPVAELDWSDLEAQLAGVRGHLQICRAVLPAMRDSHWGRIVYLSGGLATRPATGFAAYGAAKAAAATLTRYLAVEEGLEGITANVVAPGRVVENGDLTPPADPAYRELSEQLIARMTLAHFPAPSDIAQVVGFLVSEQAAQLTGLTIPINGGESSG